MAQVNYGSPNQSRSASKKVRRGYESVAMREPRYTIPEPQGDVLRRQRLLDLLYENIDHPLQLICAPAGYGKTTLLADFARDADLTVCWYSVDPLDSDPSSFLHHLMEAVWEHFPALYSPTEPSESLFLEPNRGWQAWASRLLDLIRERIPEYFVLVIDDFHIMSNKSAAADVMDFLLQRVPDNCRLIISSRETPQLPSLPRLMSQRKVSGLGANELKFTSIEIKTLLNTNFDLDITINEAERLEEESEGWVTSILLTSHSLWSGLFRDALVNRGPNSFLFEYMASEVFSQQQSVVQQFLQSTSVCNEFNAELANTLMGTHTSAEILKEIESRNLFISRLGGTIPWYRYHHLFRDFLRETLRKADPGGYSLLNVKAAEYYLSIKSPRQAIQHYIQGSEFEQALDLLEDEVERLSHEGLWETLGNWLEEIPAEMQASRPKLLLYLSRVYQLRGGNDDAIKLLNKTIDEFKDSGEHILEAQALMRRGVSLRFKGQYQMAIRDGRRALALARDYGTIEDQADAHSHLGSAYGQQGKFPRAAKECRAALKGYQQQGNLFRLSEIHTRLGSIYSDLGDFSKAATHLGQARQGWQKLGNQTELGVTLNNLAYLYYQQGQCEIADPLARESIGLAQATSSPRDEAYSLMTLADIQREQGEYTESLRSCQRSLDLARQCMETHLIAYGSFALGDTFRLLGEPERARSLLDEAVALAGEGSQDHELGLGLTSLGIVEYETGNYTGAEALLIKASHHLSLAGQKRTLARTRMHLAQTFFLSEKFVDALEQMETVALLCGELGYDRFLVPEGRHVYPLVQYAASRSKSKDFFARLRDQIQQDRHSDAVSTTPQGPPVRRPTVFAPRLDTWAFGSLKISLNGNLIPSTAWGSSKAREMLLFMLYQGQAVPKEKIVEALWPEISSAKVNSNFHSTLYRMRSALYPNCVVRDGEEYQLNPDWIYWFDFKEFQGFLKTADRLPGDGPQRESLLSSALDLYEGPFAEDTDSEWCDEIRTTLEFEFLRAVSSVAECREAKSEYQESIALLEKSLAVDALQEDIYYKIMDLYIQLDDPAAATRVYSRCLAAVGPAALPTDSPKVRRILAHLN